MRLAVTMAEKVGGGWDLLADPDTPIQTQKEIRKGLIVSKGKKGKAQYSRLVLLSTTGEVKRSRFKEPKAEPKKKEKSVE